MECVGFLRLHFSDNGLIGRVFQSYAEKKTPDNLFAGCKVYFCEIQLISLRMNFISHPNKFSSILFSMHACMQTQYVRLKIVSEELLCLKSP